MSIDSNINSDTTPEKRDQKINAVVFIDSF